MVKNLGAFMRNSNRRINLAFAITLVAFFCISVAQAAIEPQHEFEKPSYLSGHGYDGIIPQEEVDLFTGGLTISQRDIPANNVKGFDDFYPLLTRTYTSKISRQAVAGTCDPSGIYIEDEFAGLGWNLHFGRLWVDPLAQTNTVLELPDGSRHMFYNDTVVTGRQISKSSWTLKNSAGFYDACSPGPEQVCIRFPTTSAFTDSRDTRLVYHAQAWYLYHPSGFTSAVKTQFSYEMNGGLLRPLTITRPCGSTINFHYTVVSGLGVLHDITYVMNGITRTYNYTVIVQNGKRLLDKVVTPEGITYDYNYDATTLELNRMVVSTDSTIGDADDLKIDYTYATKQFYMNPLFLSAACARVVTTKRVTLFGGATQTWTYTYPTSGATTHLVTVQEPRGNQRKVTFQGYANISNTVWKVGKILQDETFQGTSSSLLRRTYTYDQVLLSSVPDPEANSYDQPRIPVVLSQSTVYPQTGQQADKTYGTAANYDRYGNPDFEITENFNGTQLRKVTYTYAHRTGTCSTNTMCNNNFVHAVTQVKLLNSSNAQVSLIDYSYNNVTSQTAFGLVNTATTWNNETGVSDYVRHFTYDTDREIQQLSEDMESGTRTTTYVSDCGVISDVNDTLTSQAGPIFNGTLDANKEVFTNTDNPTGGNLTNYSYDGDKRLTLIDPPLGDSTSITYDDLNKKVTIAQGISNRVEFYDEYGRLEQEQIKIDSGDTSYRTFVYDALGNRTSESERKLNATPTVFVTRQYDALNRVTQVVTADGTTNYLYSGPDVDIQVISELGTLTTSLTYDAAGRLTQVQEPGNDITTYAYDVADRLTGVTQGALSRTFVYSSRGKLMTETHPESGTTTYTYDRLGRTKTKTFAGGSAINYTYDIRDRMLTINYPGDPDVAFNYDGTVVAASYSGSYKSHLTSMTDGTGTTVWPSFNSLDSVTRKDITFTGLAVQSVTYAYDLRNNLETITYPDGQVVKIPRNEGNAIENVQRQFPGLSNTTLVSSVFYNAALLPSQFSFSNGFDVSIAEDNRNRPDIITAKISGSTKLSLNYRYNQRSLIDQIITNQNGSGNQTETITYDNRGRLASFQSGSTINYSFDRYGNLLSRTGSASHTYANNRINGVNYSLSGNQLQVGTINLEYDQDNRSKHAYNATTDFTYKYNGLGQRVQSTNTGTGDKVYFFYDESGNLLSEMSLDWGGALIVDKDYLNGPTGTLVTARYDQSPRQIVAYNVIGGNRARVYWKPFNDCRIKGVNLYRATSIGGPYTLMNPSCPITSYFFEDVNVTAGTTYYYKLRSVYSDNSEGSDSDVITHVYSTTAENRNAPIANLKVAPLYFHVNDHLGTTRIVSNQAGSVTGSFEYLPFGEPKTADLCPADKQQFTGKLFDTESGLQYFGARYLSNDLTRFTSVDPVDSSRLINPQSWNRYVYTLNDPMNRVDWDGRTDGEAIRTLTWTGTGAGAALLAFGKTSVVAAGGGTVGGVAAGGFIAGLYIGRNLGGWSAGNGQTIDEYYTNVFERIYLHFAEDTSAGSRAEAFNDAKRANDIPVSQQPEKVIKPGTAEGDAAGLTDENARQYEFENSKGQKISIREDKPKTYPDGKRQGPHFNSGPKGERLKTHHYWPE